MNPVSSIFAATRESIVAGVGTGVAVGAGGAGVWAPAGNAVAAARRIAAGRTRSLIPARAYDSCAEPGRSACSARSGAAAQIFFR
jgi:hypothetical protein